MLLLLGVLASLPAARALAQCLGDCEHHGAVGAGELTKIIAIINYCPCSPPAIGGVSDGCAAITGSDKQCVSADRNGDDCITAGELTGVIADLLNFSNGCPPSPTPISTPIPPTSTPIPPTATNAPTATEAVVPSATPTPHATSTATATATATPATVCGNGVIEPGETCTACPADCTVHACTATTPIHTVKVNLAIPSDETVSGLTLVVGYKSGTVSLPGTGAASTVGSRIKNKPGNSIFAFNDLDYGLRTVLSRSAGFSSGQLYTVDFDSCQGAAAVTIGDFGCTVEGCSNTFGTVTDCSCSVSL
jgi:hypothetical protein